MGSKYSSISASGYNSSPVSDDGSSTEANKVKASTILTKWTNPLKTFIEAVNTALVTALDQSARAVTENESAAATDHNRTIQVNTSSVTVTLADATTMAAGYIVSVANQSAGNITVALATATDTIDTVTNATQILGPKEVRRYIVNSSANGYLTSSSAVSINSLTEDVSPDLGADYVDAYDASAAVRKKVLLGRLGAGVLSAEQATTSGTSIDFTSIPSWVKKIIIQFVGVSTGGTSNVMVQIGDAGGIEASGYLGAASYTSNGSAVQAANFTTGFGVTGAMAAAVVLHGSMTLTLEDAANFTWVSFGMVGYSDQASVSTGGGSKSLSAALDRVRITTVNGTDAFDAGAINILYE